jgi:hypothetical protein
MLGIHFIGYLILLSIIYAAFQSLLPSAISGFVNDNYIALLILGALLLGYLENRKKKAK